MKPSPLFTLNLADLAKGFLVSTIGAVISAIQISINAGSLTFNWKQIGMTALTAGLSYLLKNFFTSAKITTHDAIE